MFGGLFTSKFHYQVGQKVNVQEKSGLWKPAVIKEDYGNGKFKVQFEGGIIDDAAGSQMKKIKDNEFHLFTSNKKKQLIDSTPPKVETIIKDLPEKPKPKSEPLVNKESKAIPDVPVTKTLVREKTMPTLNVIPSQIVEKVVPISESAEPEPKKKVPKVQRDPTELKHLDRIRKFKQSKGKVLDVSKLNLIELPEIFKNHIDVISFNASKNEFTSIESLMHLQSLERLDLSFNGLSVESLKTLNIFENLKYLNLSSNKMNVIPESIRSCKKLETLIISKNEIISIPDWIEELSNLTILDISNNNLETLPDSLSRLRRLDDLKIDGNALLNNCIFSEKINFLIQKRKIHHSKEERKKLIANALRIRKAVLEKETANIIHEFAADD